MSLLVLMSVSGSIFMLSGVCLQKTAEKFSLYKWQDVLFKTAIVLYLIPCPLGLWARRLWEEAERRTTASGFTDVRISPGRASVLLNDQGGHSEQGLLGISGDCRSVSDRYTGSSVQRNIEVFIHEKCHDVGGGLQRGGY